MEDQKEKTGGAAATSTIEDNTFEALEKDFQEVRDTTVLIKNLVRNQKICRNSTIFDLIQLFPCV